MILDQFGRYLHYLRISLTDKCNLRCIYCMREDTTFRPNAELLQDNELLTLVRLFAELGFDKFRLTGGEPTVHPRVVDLVREMAQTPGVRVLSMTTNGLLLTKLARPLAEAGLQRVNISVDTLDPARFKKVTRRGDFRAVWNGILAAEEAGLTPIKLNTVVARGFNDADVIDMARLTLDHPWQVRYIELIPLSDMADFARERVVTDIEIRERIEQIFGPLEVLDRGKLDGEARMYRIPGAPGQIGFISSVTFPFCSSCSRARLTADGVLRLCLLRDNEVNLLQPLRQGASPDDLKQIIRDGLWNKPWGHDLSNNAAPKQRVMSQIGG